jgi:RHS repeat-associated protein
LSRTLEDAATQNPYNEADGIKVQARYLYDNGANPLTSNGMFTLKSNPYRTGNEAEMGWTVSYSDKTGRNSTVKTYAGGGLPAPWGGNGNLTGTVLSQVDANTSTVTDQAGKQRRSITNGIGQLIRVDEPDDSGNLGSIGSPVQPTSYSYDTLNNLVQVNQGVQVRTFGYDSLSRLRQANNPESGQINYNYDNNGNLINKTDARGVVTNYVYDNINRVTSRNYSDGTPTVSYVYDNLPNAKGRLTQVSSSISTTNYNQFDNLGRVLASQQITDGQTYNFGYSYNLSGMLVNQTYPSGRVVTNQFETDGDLAQVTGSFNNQNKTYAGNFNYTSAGAVQAMQLGNGKWENIVFNSRLQPIQIGLGNSNNTQELWKVNYDYGTTDNNGNVKSQQITVPNQFVANQVYTYDSLNRLKSARETISNAETWKQTFTFDRYGNRKFDAAQTTTLGNCPPNVCNPDINPANNKVVGHQFDNTGNTTQDAEGRQFFYDGENKQKEVKNAQNQVIGQYLYDGDGKRVKKLAANDTTIFVYDAGGKLASEYTVSASQSQAPQTSYLTNDTLGSPRVTTDASGNVVSRRDFRPYGEEIARANQGTDKVRQKFTSYERDNETDLDFAQARYYGYTFGRFTNPDRPLLDQSSSDPQTWNLYVYSGNSPLKYTDPLGLWKKVECEGGATNCWESDDPNDTLKSLAELLGVSSQNIEEFFGNQEVVEGRVFDMSGYSDWLAQDKSNSRLANDLAYQWGSNPPLFGGVQNAGKRSGLFGWLGKKTGQFGRWAGIIKPKQAATFADLAAKQLVGSSGREMLGDALNIIKAFKGTPEEKAELMKEFAKQITQRTGGQWAAFPSMGADGSFIFTGETRPFGLVIRLDGTIFKTDNIVRDSKIIGDKLLPIYEKLIKQ